MQRPLVALLRACARLNRSVGNRTDVSIEGTALAVNKGGASQADPTIYALMGLGLGISVPL